MKYIINNAYRSELKEYSPAKPVTPINIKMNQVIIFNN